MSKAAQRSPSRSAMIGAAAGRLIGVGHRRDDDRLDLGDLDAGRRNGVARGRLGHRHHGVVRTGPTP
jgi:hypothetical protein